MKKGKTPRQKFENEEEAIARTKKIEDQTYFWSRVVRPNLKQDRHVITDLCTTEGQFERRIIGKEIG